MKTEKINITDIKPAPYNPRVIPPENMEKLTHNIKQFGLVDPIIIDLTDNNTVIGGHQRLEALNSINPEQDLTLIRLGDIGLVLKETKLKIKDKNDQKAINISLNNTNLQGDWDYQLLDEVLQELVTDNYQIDLTGFNADDILLNEEWDINDIDEEVFLELEQDTEGEAESEEPYTPLKEVEVIVKEGDKYRLGNHILFCADSKDKKNIQELIGDEKIDLVLTDPPYGINVVQNVRERERQINQRGTIGVTHELGFSGTAGIKEVVKAREYKPVLYDDEPYNPESILSLDVPTILFGANNYSSRLPDQSRWLVWYKTPEGQNNTFSDAELAWTNLPGKKVKLYRYLWSGLLRAGNRKEELIERVHPTQKPVGLLVNIINDVLQDENSNVLDLYGGSGSTLIASEKTGNKCYMMELDPYYCQIIINRYEEYTGKKAEKINT